MRTSKYKAIVDAAAQLFCEKGYNNTTLKDVADKVAETGVNFKLGNMWYHFKTKQSLLEAAMYEHKELAALIQSRQKLLPIATLQADRLALELLELGINLETSHE